MTSETPLHPRQRIREAVINHLAAVDAAGLYATEAGKRVWGGRLRALKHKDVPALLIYTPAEDGSPSDGTADRRGATRRRLDVVVEIVIAAGEDWETDLDRISQQVEDALADLAAAPGLKGLGATVDYGGGFRVPDTQGEDAMAAQVLQFTVTYWVARPIVIAEGTARPRFSGQAWARGFDGSEAPDGPPQDWGGSDAELPA